MKKVSISKVVSYILRQISLKKVTANVVSIAPNDLLKGKTAIITGGTSGIGLSIAKSFINSGANVIITGRNRNKLNHAYELLKSLGTSVTVEVLELDNSDIASIEEKIPEFLKKHVNVDILVNNAGVIGGFWSNATSEQYDNVMNTNLKGTFFLSRLIARHMIKNKIEGHIVNICSSSSNRPADSAYALSKWGLKGFTLGMAKSLIKHGVIVNGIAPGPTATPMLGKGGENIRIDNRFSPLGRMTLPEEIANMAVFLASPLGNSIVGDVINMSGGSGLITFDDISYDFE